MEGGFRDALNGCSSSVFFGSMLSGAVAAACFQGVWRQPKGAALEGVAAAWRNSCAWCCRRVLSEGAFVGCFRQQGGVPMGSMFSGGMAPA